MKFVSHASLVVLILTGAAALPAAAQAGQQGPYSDGPYIGLAGGATKYKLKRGELPATGQTLGKLDERDKGGKLLLGYRLNEYFAVEAQYALLGEAKFDVTGTGGALSRYKYEAGAAGVSLVGTLPLGSGFSAFGKLGASRVQVELKPESGGGPRFKTNANSSLIGVGLGYAISNELQLRVELEQYGKAGKRERGGRSSIQQATVGVTYQF